MSVYVYEHAGRRIEREFPIGTAPSSLRVKGRRYRRALTLPHVSIADQSTENGQSINFASTNLHPDMHKFHRGRFHTDSNGESQPVFTSRSQIRDFERCAAEHGQPIHYGSCRPPKFAGASDTPAGRQGQDRVHGPRRRRTG